jgi:hypothetical protein
VDSCPALDANALAVRGCLHPGRSGIYPWPGGNGVIVSICFHCEALSTPNGCGWRLFLSYATPASSGEGGGERTEIISISRVTYRSGARHLYFLCPGAGCGRRVGKLYRSRGRFLCRHCSGLVYASHYYEQYSWQRAFGRANKLRRRLGITGASVPDKPKGMPVATYERLLEAVQQAETQATEAGTARLLQLIDQFDRRHKPPFTLD